MGIDSSCLVDGRLSARSMRPGETSPCLRCPKGLSRCRARNNPTHVLLSINHSHGAIGPRSGTALSPWRIGNCCRLPQVQSELVHFCVGLPRATKNDDDAPSQMYYGTSCYRFLDSKALLNKSTDVTRCWRFPNTAVAALQLPRARRRRVVCVKVGGAEVCVPACACADLGLDARRGQTPIGA